MNGILVLANNLNYFRFFVKNYPSEIKNDNYKLFVVNEVKIGNKLEELNNILENSDITNYVILSSETIYDKFKEDYLSNNFVDEYTMGMNILSLWYVKKYFEDVKKLLWLDDDVILNKNISKVFESDTHLFKTNRLSAGSPIFESQSKNSKNIYNEWFRIFNIKFSQDWWINEYIKKYSNSGQFLVNLDKLDIKNYESKLCDFYRSDIFYTAWTNRRTHTSWYFDERFITLYFFDFLNDGLKKKAYLLLSKPEKLNSKAYENLKNFPIIHVCNNSHKMKTYQLLVKNGVIKDC